VRYGRMARAHIDTRAWHKVTAPKTASFNPRTASLIDRTALTIVNQSLCHMKYASANLRFAADFGQSAFSQREPCRHKDPRAGKSVWDQGYASAPTPVTSQNSTLLRRHPWWPPLDLNPTPSKFERTDRFGATQSPILWCGPDYQPVSDLGCRCLEATLQVWSSRGKGSRVSSLAYSGLLQEIATKRNCGYEYFT